MGDVRYNELHMRIQDPKNVELIVPGDPNPKNMTINVEGLTLKTLNLFKDLLATDRIKNSTELSVLGSHLYKALFTEEINNSFEDEVKKTRDDDENNILRLVLTFEEDAMELGEFPWEYLYYPYGTDNYFVSTRARIILTRYIPETPEMILTPDEKPLRILCVISYPEGMEKSHTEAINIYNTIKDLEDPDHKKIIVDLIVNSFEQLTNRIERKDFHVLHIFSQGRMQNDEGSLLFIKEGEEKGVPADIFADYFEKGEPRLIFFHLLGQAVEQTEDTCNAFRKVAESLVHKGIPAVITMQYPIETILDQIFVKKFYQSLGQGKPIDVAVHDGRSELLKNQNDYSSSSQSFGSPIVFLQNPVEIIRMETTIVKCPFTGCDREIQSGDESTRVNFCPSCGHEFFTCECGHWPVHEALDRCPECKRIIRAREREEMEPTDAIERVRPLDQTTTESQRATRADWRDRN